MSSSYDAAIAILAGPAAARSSPAASSASAKREEASPRTSGDTKTETKPAESEPLISPLGALALVALGLGGFALWKRGKPAEEPAPASSEVEAWLAAGPTDFPREDNPATWVRDEALWERAKAEVLPDWDKYEQPWAVVTHVYEQMGGRIG